MGANFECDVDVEGPVDMATPVGQRGIVVGDKRIIASVASNW
jgi:hypothetical protein